MKKKNIISNKILKIIYLHSYTQRTIISFYKYFNVLNLKELLNCIQVKLKKYDVLGRIYIAQEGINAQISIPDSYINIIINFFKNLNVNLNNININFSIANKIMAFWKLKIKIRKQLVANNIHNIPVLKNISKNYLNAIQVNQFFLDNNSIFIDIRNHYEYEIGHFHNALEIPANTFREQLGKLKNILLPHKNKKIVLYCTGGIRCEKAAGLLKRHEFKNIYQIYGGILGYINQTQKHSLPMYFKGKLFVFDNRLSERVTNDILSTCKNCKQLTDGIHINCAYHECHQLFIQCKNCFKEFKSYCSKKCLNS